VSAEPLAFADERFQEDAPNYRYLRAAITGGALGRPARVLDFGCGLGQFVRHARAQGLDVEGVDAYSDEFARWRARLPPEIADRVRTIEAGRIPHPDASFDAVIANFVFEHIETPAPALAEIARVLKPGGAFLALFPTGDTWYEGHAGLYFVHWLAPWPGAQRAYLRAAHAMGLGYHRGALAREKWADGMARSLAHGVHHHCYADVRRWWRDAFGEAPRSLAADFVLFRIRESRFRRAAGLAALAPWLLRALCHVRAGRVLLTCNRKPTA
jgi:SAM-dependent methyltransferase